MKSQKIDRGKTKKTTTIIDNRTKSAPDPVDAQIMAANKPVRCLNFVEIGNLDPKQVQLMIQELGTTYQGARGGIHYFLPLRHGKITTDILFEQEILDMVNKMCEVKNGEIVLKGGDVRDIEVIRRTV
jgi:hypothetical protein